MSTSTAYANETNPIADGYYDKMASGTISLAEVARRGGKVTRVRILSDWAVSDISYVHAEIAGERFNVQVDAPNLIPRGRVKAELIEWAKREGVYAKGLGLLDESNWSVLG